MEEDLYIVDQEVPTTKLTDDYLEFTKNSDSFQGWLVTLTEEELDELALDLERVDDKHIAALVFIRLLGRLPVIGDKIDSEEFDKVGKRIAISISFIGLVKKGLLTYVVADRDEDWFFKRTELGEKVNKKLNEG